MEIWDLYDENRVKTSETMIRGDEIPQDYYHLVVESIIINSKNEVLIQRRHLEKIGFPGYWEFSCGGSATTGDSSKDAIMREIQEEIGINIDIDNIVEVRLNTFEQSHYDFYLIKQDISIDDIVMQAEEVIDVKWVKREDILSMLKNDTFVPYHHYGRDYFNYLEMIINENNN